MSAATPTPAPSPPPHQVIELPARIEDCHYPSVLALLRGSLVADASSEHALRACEKVPGFSTALLRCCLDHANVPPATRLLAAISLKNVVHRQWRPTLARRRRRLAGVADAVAAAPQGVLPAEQDTVRNFLLARAIPTEPSEPVARQLAAAEGSDEVPLSAAAAASAAEAETATAETAAGKALGALVGSSGGGGGSAGHGRSPSTSSFDGVEGFGLRRQRREASADSIGR